ncbi:MAG: C25 family cysteine peptidase [candidate division WOR-3 bacterium]
MPDDREMKLRIISEEIERLDILPVMPSKGNISRSVSPSSVAYTFSDFYSSEDIFPAGVVTLSGPFIVRDFRGLSVYINPVRYDAGNQQLIVLKNLVIEVYSEGISLSNIKERSKKCSVSPSVKNLYKEFFINYKEGKLRYEMLEEDAGRMAIICADQYVSEMDSFLIWKRRKGIRTDLYSLSEVGNDTASIRNFIKNQYDSLGITFCLLVGDGFELPPPNGTVGMAVGNSADHIYAYTEGEDYYPDIFIGRFSSDGGETINIRNQVMRSIKYERNPQVGENWYRRGLMIASAETDDYDSIMDKQRCEWLKDTLLYNIPPYFTYTSIDSSYDPWGTRSIVTNAIDSGVSIINYIGHGYVSGWQSGGGLTINSIANLTNYWMLPHVISVGCRVGDFENYDCFSEAAMTAGTPENPTGFIVTLAPTINQTWVPPCIGQEGAVNLLAHYQANTAGGVYFNGLCYMIEQYGGDTVEYGVEIAQTWNIFGDPSLQLRTDIPRSLKISKLVNQYFDSLVVKIDVYEEDSLTPVEDALVALYKGVDSLISSGYTDESGIYQSKLDPSDYDMDEYLYITVTGFNCEPRMDSINIGDFIIPPDFYTYDISKLINGSFLEVEYVVPQAMNVEFIIFDALGRRIISDESEVIRAGNFRRQIDLQNLSPGVYFLMMEAGDEIMTPKKFILIR